PVPLKGRDWLVVGRRKLQRRERVALHPPHLLSQQRCGIAEQRAREEVQLDAARGIVMRDGEDLGADRGVDAELFLQLAAQAVGQRFTRLAFPARELPVALEVHAFLPSRDQVRAVTLDHGGGDDESHARSWSGLNGYARQPALIAQTRHAGLRAVQSVAPKSISAWLKSKTWRCGSTVRETSHRWRFIACVFGLPRPMKTRNNTRATLVSRIAARRPKAKLMTAPAVYSPMPLNDRSVSSSSGTSPP